MSGERHDNGWKLAGNDLRDVLELADGSIDPRRRAEVEARVVASPALSAALAQQRTAVHAIQAVAVPAPASLRARIEAERERAADSTGAARGRRAWSPSRSSERRPGWWPRGRAFTLAGGVAVAAAVALALALVLPGGTPGAPTVVEAAGLGTQPPAAGPPPPDPVDPRLLDAQQAGVAYPNWKPKFGWAAGGKRSDDLDGRATSTVYYEKRGRTLAYTIVDGRPLENPEGGERTTVEGTELTTLEQDGRTVVTWLRGGHTCVLSGEGVDTKTMLELAGWKGKGAVEF